jgi:signal transduction histidine kinase
LPTNRIIFECVDAALSKFEWIDKETFYLFLKQKYQVNTEKFADDFEAIHKALKDSFGINHFKIEREIIKILNDRAKDGTYKRYDEVQAFGRIVNVFMTETEENIKHNKSLALMSKYARNLEQEVKDTNEKLQTALRLAAIGETAAMVGHDIRNPLQAIVGELYLERLEIEELPEGSNKKNLIDSIRAIEDNLFYINKIVSDLQDFAKPLKDEVKEKVDINSAIAEVLTIVPIADNLQVEIYISKDFPILKINAQMLKRALTNLVQNAVQAMPKGGKLTINATVDNESILIGVEDTGEGISEEVKPNFSSRCLQPNRKVRG